MWQAWAIQGAVLLGLAIVATITASMRLDDWDEPLPIAAVALFVLAATSFIISGWVAPWTAP